MPSKNVSAKKAKKEELKNTKKNFSWNIVIGGIFIIVALFIPLNTFSPVLKAEISYQLNKKNSEFAKPTPADLEFSIIIPKINANSKVIKNVDPFNSKIYQKALTQGVAHALDSATPDKSGNVFIFAHSAGNWYQANQYNAVFYLLNKLTKGDLISIYYLSKKYDYNVKELKFVTPTDIEFMNPDLSKYQLTLMTCWPPGTTLKRLVIIAELKNAN